MATIPFKRFAYAPKEQVFNDRLIETARAKRPRLNIRQDPYHEEGQANGLAFSVHKGQPIPRSLSNIFKELKADLNIAPSSGDLTPWAKNGVLLLNSVLTVEKGRANSHKNWGWKTFVRAVVHACNMLPQPIVFIFWGNQAREFCDLITDADNTKKITCSSHPSPLSASRGTGTAPAFIGSRPFSTANHLLMSMRAEPVNWILPERRSNTKGVAACDRSR